MRWRQSRWSLTLLRTRMVIRGAGIDAIEPRLRAAPYAEPGREIAIHGPSDPGAAVDEQVAAVEASHAALEIGVESEAPGQRPIVESALDEKREGVAAAAIFSYCLAPFRGDPDGDADQRMHADSG